MKLNNECVRDVLLMIENSLIFDSKKIEEISFDEVNESIYNKGLNPRYTMEEIYYTTLKLGEAGFLTISIDSHDFSDVSEIKVSSLTWEGHKFLDNIRDPQVWKTTKKVASKLESVAVTTLSNIGSTVITNLITQNM